MRACWPKSAEAGAVAWKGQRWRSLKAATVLPGAMPLRAAVLGANDGLVSNFSLVMGVAGAEMSAAPFCSLALAVWLAGRSRWRLASGTRAELRASFYQRQITNRD